MLQDEEMAGETGAMTFEKETIPGLEGIESIELGNKSYRVKQFFACNDDWIDHFFISPFNEEKYRIPGTLVLLDLMKQEDQPERRIQPQPERQIQPHSSCCTIL